MEGITVLWYSGFEKKFEPYDKEEHLEMAREFLFWSQGLDGRPLLIVGDGGYLGGHQGLWVKARSIVPKVKPDGAGRFGFSQQKRIDTWKSISFEVETPLERRPVIEEALGIK